MPTSHFVLYYVSQIEILSIGTIARDYIYNISYFIFLYGICNGRYVSLVSGVFQSGIHF